MQGKQWHTRHSGSNRILQNCSEKDVKEWSAGMPALQKAGN
jgi:hypothetical protein